MLKTGNILIYKTPNNYMLLRVISCQYASYENEYKVRGSFWVTELIGGKVLFDKKQLNISSDNKYPLLYSFIYNIPLLYKIFIYYYIISFLHCTLFKLLVTLQKMLYNHI